MSTEWVMTVIAALLASGIAGCFKMALSLSTRMTRIETTFELMGKKGLKGMHCPTDKHGIDALIDKYNLTHNLTMQEWMNVKAAAERSIESPESTDGEKSFAMWALALACHKLQMFGHVPRVQIHSTLTV